MREIYIFDQQGDELLTVLSEDNGLISAPVHDTLNTVSDAPFVFTVEANAVYTQKYDSSHNLTQVASSFIGIYEDNEATTSENVSPARFVKERNRVVLRDRVGDFREFVIEEIDDIDDIDGPETTATCIPAWLYELRKKIVEDRRFTDRTAQFALDAALANTRYTGVVSVDLGTASTNFYHLEVSECIWEIMNVWGGDFKDTVTLNEQGRISARTIHVVQRRGADNGARFEIDHNIESIERTIISDPVTAMYGWGASLETEGGGHTRYIDFADVEWKVSNGDPVDKPLGQKWVGDPDALQAYGLEKDGGLIHLYGQMSNQNYDNPEDLLRATWEYLQIAKNPEVNYKLSADEFDKPVELGDTAVGIDRNFARPIEIQTRVIGIEYDILNPDEPAEIEMGQFLSLNEPLGNEIDDIRKELDDTRGKVDAPISKDKYPDIKPAQPVNIFAIGGYEVIQIYWDYTDELFVEFYEIYGSKVADFVPDTQHLLWRGKVSAFSHAVNTNETWYYYVRAVNYHGTASDFSVRAQAATMRIIDDDTLFGAEMAQKLRDLNAISDIIGAGGIDLSNFSDDITELAYDGSVRIKGDLIHLDGLTLIDDAIIQAAHIANASIGKAHLKQAIIDDAHIDSLTGVKFVAHSITADKLYAASLSAISANLGTVTAGIMQSVNNNMTLNLNTGSLLMQNADFTLGGGARIDFANSNNRIVFSRKDPESTWWRYAGLGVGININARFPYVYLGTTAGGNGGLNATDAEYFTGFIANTNARMAVDGIGNSVVGDIFHVRDLAVAYSRGWTFDLRGTRKYIAPLNSGTYTYDLGNDTNYFQRVYAESFYSHEGNMYIRNHHDTTQGFRAMVGYDGQTRMSFYGLNAGNSWNNPKWYELGRSNNRFSYIWLYYQPDVESDERQKRDITDNVLGLAFMKDIATKTFILKHDTEGNVQLGLIAQQVLGVLDKYNVTNQTIVKMGESGNYGMQYTQMLMPTIKAVQELDDKVDSEIALLKARLNTLEAKVA